MSAIGQSTPHESASEHVRGSAAYLDDLPPIRGELCVDFVGSSVAHGVIQSIDVDAARKAPGIVAVFTASDVPENMFGPSVHDEEVLAQQVVPFLGYPVLLIAGESKAAVQQAKKLVRVEVDAQPAILTIDDAVAAGQFIGPERVIRSGDVDAALAQAPHRLNGEFSIGGQEHFYLEAQAALAVPHEAGQMVVHSSTQNPTEIQILVARVLKRSMAQISCMCRRMGGGFGGKETQAAWPAVFAALVAARTGRPARCVFGHEQDFQTTGKRHEYRVHYEFGFDDVGRLSAYRARFYSNGGFSADLSLAVMERTLLHAENAYHIPNVEFRGRVCRTNLPSNTAFRGFGGPQAVAAMENVIEEVAAHLGIDSALVRRRNLYGNEQTTPYGQPVQNNTLPELFDRLVTTSSYQVRREEIQAFNEQSETHLRGIALTPVKFGISFTRKTMNQANALVHVQTDGTIQVSTGGTEMGQGLNTKLRQIVADEFAVAQDQVVILPTSTERNHNTSPTAASASTDLNGTAALNACRQIKAGMAALLADRKLRIAEWPGDASYSPISFVDAVRLAHEERVDLGARGFYATPGIEFDRETGRGTPFLYFTNGAAVTEVEIDRWLGDVTVRRVDLLMDLGRMINPAIDRGQVVGGFVQGMGWVTTEALVYGSGGQLLSDSATTYKIPNVTDVPADFRVNFLERHDNPVNLCGSKAMGEPPLLLAVSVWAAVKQALGSLSPGRIPQLSLPATNEEVLLRLSELAGEAAGDRHSTNGVAATMPQTARK